MAESRNQRILIVDNDEKESNRLEAIVQEAGYDTISTWSGFEALELLKSQKIDILLVSSYLPDLYIGDFLARVRSLPVSALLDRHAGGARCCPGFINGTSRVWRRKTLVKMKGRNRRVIACIPSGRATVGAGSPFDVLRAPVQSARIAAVRIGSMPTICSSALPFSPDPPF